MYSFKTIAISSEAELQRCFTIRETVFCDEQGFSRDIELDEIDRICTHFLLFRAPKDTPVDTSDPEAAIGVARMFAYPADKSVAKIGRVAVLKPCRFGGAGSELMRGVEDEARRQGFASTKLHAQLIAKRFYDSCGYSTVGDVFDEEGEPHIVMVKQL